VGVEVEAQRDAGAGERAFQHRLGLDVRVAEFAEQRQILARRP
jgi:hypothetical protein